MLYDCRKNYDRLNILESYVSSFYKLDRMIKQKGIFYAMQIIALITQKGGVGKTTCAINIGAGLNKFSKRVLLIDLDSWKWLC